MYQYDVGQPLTGNVEFDTSQFQDVEVHATLMEYRNRPDISFWHRIGQGGSITAKPHIHGNRIFVGACDHNFYCLDMDGKEIWRFTTQGTIQEEAKVVDGLVIVGSRDGNLYALEAETGKEKWRFQAQGPFSEAPAFHQGKLYAPSEDNRMYCLDAKTGKMEWYFSGQKALTTPLIFNNRLYFGYMDQLFYCLNMDGKLLWKYPTQGIIAAWPPVTDGKRLFFGSWDKNLYCLNMDGKLLWKKQLTEQVMCPYYYEGKLYLGCWDKNIYCIDAENGQVVWKFQTQDIVTSYFEVYKGVCYAASTDHSIYALDAKTGKLLWQYKTNGLILQCVTRGGRVYAGSWDCNLYCLNTDGTLAWKFKTSMASPSQIAPPETGFMATSEVVIPQEEIQEKQDRYKVQTLGEGSSSYVKKSDYVQEHKYTKTRKIKSMSSGWED